MTRRQIGLLLLMLLGAVAPARAQEELSTTKIYLGATPVQLLSGSADPEGAVAAPMGSQYYRTATGQTYVKASGTGTTGWAALVSGSGGRLAASQLFVVAENTILGRSAGAGTGDFGAMVTLPTGVQGNISSLGTITAGTWNAGSVTTTGTVTAGAATVTGTLTATTLAATAAATVGTNLTVTGTVEGSGLYNKASWHLWNKAGNAWLTWATRNTAGAEAVLDLTNIGSLTTTSFFAANLYGSSVADGDLTIEGTSHATKTTSYVILQPTGGNVGIGTASPDNKLSVSGNVGITGNLSLVGNVASSLIPSSTDLYDLGRFDKLWDEAYISVINAVVFAETTATLFGGYSIVGKQAGSFAADVASAATTIDFGQTMTPGHWALTRAKDTSGIVRVEYFLIGSLVSGTTYTVTRDLNGSYVTDPAWASGVPFLVLGATGDGRIEQLAYDGKPRILFIQQGATYNSQNDRAILGNLNGYYGYATDIFGLAAGDPGGTNITVDPTNGFRIRSGTVNKFAADAAGNLALTGNITLGTGGSVTSGGVTLNDTGLYISPLAASGGGVYTNANAVRWTTDTTYRTAIWRSDDTSSDAYKRWNFDLYSSATGAESTAQTQMNFVSKQLGAASAFGQTDLTLKSAAEGGHAFLVAKSDTVTKSALLTMWGNSVSPYGHIYLGLGQEPSRYPSGQAPTSFSGLDIRSTGTSVIGAFTVVQDNVGVTHKAAAASSAVYSTIRTSADVLRSEIGFLAASSTAFTISNVESGLFVLKTNNTTFMSATNVGAVSFASTVDTSSSMTASLGYYELGRTVRQGFWETRAFAAGNYTSDVGGSWTVAAADVTTEAWTLAGKTLTFTAYYNATTVATSPVELRVLIPSSFVAARTAVGVCRVSDNGARQFGTVYVVAGGTNIIVLKDAAGTGSWAASTDATFVQVTFTFEIQ